MADFLRHEMKNQSPEQRVKNFDEVALGFDKTTAKAEAERCLNCKNAPCRKGCPVGVNIPAFISYVKNDDMDGAVASLNGDNSLPAVCGRVCPQERQCERFCVRREKAGGSVSIGALERYVADYALKKGKQQERKVKTTGKTAAVIGSGPASLTCAADLQSHGFDVTVFEAFHKAGGVLVYGIPEFRLPKDIVKKEIDNLSEMGVKFRFDTIIGKTFTLDELRKNFDAVFIGTGAGLPLFLKIKGENLPGVYSANEYLTRVNLMKAYDKNSITPVQRGKHVVVVGAGNVAMDAARTAVRMGADDVTLVYRRGREEMPARREEIIHAEEEGVKFELLTNPAEILGTDGKVSGIRCVRMELGEPDSSGRRSPHAIEGSEFDIICDQVIVALGTSPNPLLRDGATGLEITSKGTIVVNPETGETSLENVYAGGDAVTGAATVILAMGAGRLAAKSIIEKLGDKK
ncbi:MAG: NADPH-dependent glutamate synthase [Christensenellaceae bacterium]|nr:NADPH-dependent glutamate synthase [Christensenellaceae bacterium]